MQDPIQEPKQTVDDTIDKFFDDREASAGEEQPQENAQPEIEQPEVPQEDGTDPAKTENTEEADSFKGADKGFANHPAWQKREQKLKEAEAKLKELEESSSVYTKLLDDPLVYKRYLEARGFDAETIKRALADKGFAEETKATTSQAPTAQGIAEATCKKLGWDISRLNDNQKAYINDQIQLIQAVAEDLLGKALDNRLKPMEGYLQKVEQNERISTEYDKAKAEAKNEFPDLDWEKDIEPAMARYLDDLDKKDPKRTIKIGPYDLYEKATRQLLKEKKLSEERQDARNDLKGNAKPLLPRTPVRSNGNSAKGKTVKETADRFLDSIGFKE